MMKNDYLKKEYLEMAREDCRAGNENTLMSYRMILKLREMAENDVWPDGRFSDDECNLCGIFRKMKKGE